MMSKLQIVFWFLCYFEAFAPSSSTTSRNQEESILGVYQTTQKRPENMIRTYVPNQGIGGHLSGGSHAFSEIPLLDEELQLVNATKLTTITSTITWIQETGSGDDASEVTLEKKPKSVNEETSQISVTSEQSLPTKEGSGDWTKEVNTTAGTDKGKLLSQSCTQTLCNSSELRIHRNSILFAPESTNITIPCEAESSNETYLEWYQSNGTEFLFRTGTKNKTLSLALSETTRLDSGLYICIQKNVNSCCHAQIRLHIYVIPNYKKHLIIAGAVTVGCVVVCMLLCVWRNQSLKNYKKQFKSVKCEKHQLLLP